ncbi:protein AMBP-like isoform X2 [Cheilinus undulatus]|uniref:protein AMBP-like isoform X2 n=1 Tax=Cheilinus undulatus TaxID=241271 RepID=UPI001BD473B5|nr:protein AMBP-like isoform X2 [Cheilinus undulatus]
MQRVVNLLSVLVLGSAWTLRANHVDPGPLVVPQESFDVGQFMGRWYEVAVISTCPNFMQRKRGNPVIVAMELQQTTSEDSFTMTSTTFRNGSCKQTSTDYSLTNTPGGFFHHVARFGVDVDSFVVHTNYTDFAKMIQLSTEKPSGNKTTIAKLFSRTMNVDSAVLNDFKSLVRQHGMSDDDIIINQSKGDCEPGVRTKPVSTEPQVPAALL